MNNLKSLIGKHEGLRLQTYMDTEGHLTVGYGHKMDEGISQHVAEIMLDEDIQIAVVEANKFRWFDDLDDVRQAVIINMIFNLGMTRFSMFKKTIHFMELSMYIDAAEKCLILMVVQSARADDLSE